MARIGIDVGGTKCLGVVVEPDDRGWAIVTEQRVDTPSGATPLLDAVAGLAEALSDGRTVDAVGVGLPGFVHRSGRLRFAPNLPGVVEVDVATPLRDRLGLPVHVDNDATCAAWAEHLAGAARGQADCLLVTLGTGIGGGLVAGGVLQRGTNGFAGEIGHMVVVVDGESCPCGQRGCWERYASGSALGRLGRGAVEAGRAPGVLARAGGDAAAVRGEHVAAAALEGDAGALGILDELGRWIAVGAVNLVVTLDPSVIVVSGGLVDLGDLVLAPAQRHVAALLPGREHRPVVPLVPAELGHRAGAIGAALLGLSER